MASSIKHLKEAIENHICNKMQVGETWIFAEPNAIFKRVYCRELFQNGYFDDMDFTIQGLDDGSGIKKILHTKELRKEKK